MKKNHAPVIGSFDNLVVFKFPFHILTLPKAFVDSFTLDWGLLVYYGYSAILIQLSIQ